MEIEVYSLMICIEIFGFIHDKITICYDRGALDKIDNVTYSYDDPDSFFEANLKKIEKKLFDYCIQHKLMYPSDLQLVNIYLESPCRTKQESKKIAPLFKMCKGKYKYSDIALKKLLHTEQGKENRFYWLLRQDATNSLQNFNYASIFPEGYLNEFLNLPSETQTEEIINTWTKLEKEEYFVSILRAILGNAETLTVKSSKRSQTYSRQKEFRLPYHE